MLNPKLKKLFVKGIIFFFLTSKWPNKELLRKEYTSLAHHNLSPSWLKDEKY